MGGAELMKGLFTYILFIAAFCNAQEAKVFMDDHDSDSTKRKKKVVNLSEVEVSVQKDNTFGISRLNNIEGTTINAGKKSEAIYVGDLNANLAANNSRQIFSKVAGMNIFESDGTGTQIGIGGRGLNPNRVSNFNMRQNGYDISADALGYPESYYTPPTEAIDRIEVLRGAASLQFGTQFGGMINYKYREAPLNKRMSGTFRQTGGSFGFINSFNQLNGTVGRVSYNCFYQYKTYKGWRERSDLTSHNAYGSIKWFASDNLIFKFEYTHMNYLAQQAGGLTDKQFAEDPYKITRSRNWFKVNWNLMALTTDYIINPSLRLNIIMFGLDAGRDALGYLGRPDRQDDTASNRNLHSDKYNNMGSEIRLLKRYSLNNNNSHFLIGARYYKGNTDRKQGEASKRNDADFRFLNPNDLENSSYIFPSQNVSLFVENIFQITKKWNVTPGVRFEHISTNSKGYYRLMNKDLAGNVLLDMKINDDRTNTRQIFLMGLGTQYKVNDDMEFYMNFSQNYRSINFNDMRIVNPNFQVDPNLKDERGFTFDGGLRGIVKNLLYYDISAFLLSYQNRIGTVLRTDSLTYQIIRYRTNVSDSRNLGVEAFAELDWMKLISNNSKHKVSTFINLSYIDARYINSDQSAYRNKLVEYVPKYIVRTGVNYGIGNFKFTAQYAYTDSQFSDATNAEFTPSAIYGIIPAYSVVDCSASYTYKKFTFSGGVNNALNALYFTRRSDGYPGPGILPSDPRNFYLTLQYKF